MSDKSSIHWLSENPIVPEPEVLKGVEDLLAYRSEYPVAVTSQVHDEHVLEAYRRGRQSK